jgi:transposase InsO family protein
LIFKWANKNRPNRKQSRSAFCHLYSTAQGFGRKGNCWDNSPTERVFRSLKHEQLNYEKFATRDQAKLSVIDYLAFYNGRRSHSKLG